MATASFRNGAVGRGAVKADSTTNRTSSINSAPKSSSLKSKSSAPPHNSGLRRNSTGSVAAASTKERGGGRVRVAVRLRPRNAEEMVADADFGP